jgi:hypothetical protein
LPGRLEKKAPSFLRFPQANPINNAATGPQYLTFIKSSSKLSSCTVEDKDVSYTRRASIRLEITKQLKEVLSKSGSFYEN